MSAQILDDAIRVLQPKGGLPLQQPQRLLFLAEHWEAHEPDDDARMHFRLSSHSFLSDNNLLSLSLAILHLTSDDRQRPSGAHFALRRLRKPDSADGRPLPGLLRARMPARLVTPLDRLQLCNGKFTVELL
jgi:hypothetical protein